MSDETTALRGARGAALAVRFGVEMGALAALAYWGVRTGDGPLGRAALGLGAPLLAAAVWGLFVAPRARVRLPDGARLLIGLGVFGVAAVSLVAVGATALGVAYAAVALVDSAWVYANGDL